MIRGRITAAVAAVSIAVAAPGCGLGPGPPSEGEATLTVTRNYGAEPVLEVSRQDPPAAETVIRFLDREAEITTRYGGGFVDSIEGTSGAVSDGRSSDWFFFVNGIESPRGGADVAVRGGDRIWWDYRDWTDAMRTPAVVGSWPEPFLQASTAADERAVAVVECAGPAAACDEAEDRLAAEGVALGEPGDDASPRLLVGPWGRVRSDPAAAQIEQGPAASGVFARFSADGGDGWDLVALDRRAEESRRLDRGAGLVAALRRGEEPATWVITGTDAAGVEAAVALLGDGLADRYAVVADGSGAALAVPEGAG